MEVALEINCQSMGDNNRKSNPFDNNFRMVCYNLNYTRSRCFFIMLDLVF